MSDDFDVLFRDSSMVESHKTTAGFRAATFGGGSQHAALALFFTYDSAIAQW